MKYKILSALNDIWYKYVRNVLARFSLIGARILFIFGRNARARDLCAMSLRYRLSGNAISFYKRVLSEAPYKPSDFSVGVSLAEASIRTIVVKWPELNGSKMEKGVVVITFTRTFSFFLKEIAIEKFSEFFYIVLEPSWSGYADADIFGFLGRASPVVIQASELEDRVLISSFPETFVPVSFGASDWVDSKIFDKKATGKIYDSIYIANTNPIKRVKRYLDAIRTIVGCGNNNYVGCLVCAAWGNAEGLIRKLISSYGLDKNIIVKFSLTREQVIEHLNLAKVNLLLSYKEGSNRSLFEAMFCDVPVICLKENIGVNKAYINEFTGILTTDKCLEQAMLWFVEGYKNFSPRKWSLENISPPRTTAKLAEVISSQVGNGFGIDLSKWLIKTNNPEVSYFEFPRIKHESYSKNLLELFVTKKTTEDISEAVFTLRETFYSEININL